MFSYGKASKPKSHSVTEFQGVILAGFGNRLYPLTEDDHVPKALLPVVNKPMIYYQVQWLENAGIHDIIVVCHRTAANQIRNYISKVYEEVSETDIKIEALDEWVGSADALRAVKDKIKTDFIVMSCDLITDLPPHQIIDTHRVLNPTAITLFYEFKSEDRPSSREQDNTEYIGIDPRRSQLLYTGSKADMEGSLSLRMQLLTKFPVLSIYSQLRDAHLYVFKKWVIDLIAAKKSISSIRNELLPLLIKCQYRERLAQKEGIDKFLATIPDHQKPARTLSTTGTGVFDPTKINILALTPPKESFCARVNTVWTYAEVNRQMSKLGLLSDPRIPPSSTLPLPPSSTTSTTTSSTQPTPDSTTGPLISAKTQIGPDSVVGDGSRIGERTSVKKSVIGAHCVIGKNVRISNSVIMDYVVIEDGVKLESCVVCSNAKISEKSVLKDCDVGAWFVVEKDTTGKQEQFVKSEIGMDE